MTARGNNLYVNQDTGEPCALTADGVRKSAARVGLTEKVSGHSAPIGKAISFAQAGASLVDIQTASGSPSVGQLSDLRAANNLS